MPNPFTIAIRSADKKMRQISRKFAKVALHIQLAHQMALTGLSVLGRIRPPFASTKRSQFPIHPLKRELSVWIGITKEIWGVPSHKVGGAPGVGSL